MHNRNIDTEWCWICFGILVGVCPFSIQLESCEYPALIGGNIPNYKTCPVFQSFFAAAVVT